MRTSAPGQPQDRLPSDLRNRVWRWIYDSYTREDGKATPIPLSPPAVGRLHEIHVPALIVAGDFDTKAILLMTDAMVEGIPGARKVIFPGVAHMVPLEVPNQFNETVMSFLPGS